MNKTTIPEALTYDGPIHEGATYAAEVFTALVMNVLIYNYRDHKTAAAAFRDSLAARLSAELDDTENVLTDHHGEPYATAAVFGGAAVYAVAALFEFHSWELPSGVRLTVRRHRVSMEISTPGLFTQTVELFDATVKPLANCGPRR